MRDLVTRNKIALSSVGSAGVGVGLLACALFGFARGPREPTPAELRAAALAMVPSNVRECTAVEEAGGKDFEAARGSCQVLFPAPAPAPPVTDFASCMLRGDELLRTYGSSSEHETFRLNLKACRGAFSVQEEKPSPAPVLESKHSSRMTPEMLMVMEGLIPLTPPMLSGMKGTSMPHVDQVEPAPGVRTPPVNVEQPSISVLDRVVLRPDEGAVEWVSMTLSKAMTFDFVHLQQWEHSDSPGLSPMGKESLKKALDKAEVIKAVQDTRAILSASSLPPLSLQKLDTVSGRGIWEYQLPFNLVLDTQATRTTKLLVLKVHAYEDASSTSENGRFVIDDISEDNAPIEQALRVHQ